MILYKNAQENIPKLENYWTTYETQISFIYSLGSLYQSAKDPIHMLDQREISVYTG